MTAAERPGITVRGTRITTLERKWAIRFFPIRGQVGSPVPSKETNERRALSIVPSAMTTTPAGANSIKPLLVSTPVIRQVPAAVGVVRKETRACPAEP